MVGVPNLCPIPLSPSGFWRPMLFFPSHGIAFLSFLPGQLLHVL